MKRFFRRRYWDRVRARELEAQIEIETAQNIANGMMPAEARFAAQRKLGNTTRIREEIYYMNSLGFLETIWLDLRFGARLLRLSPGFTIVALLSLALGIGANTAIFQLLDALRLRSLPVRNPQELAQVRIVDMTGARGSMNGPYEPLTNPLWEHVRDRQEAFSGIFAWATETFDLSRGGEARNAQGLWVSGGAFQTLGVQPVLGRVFAPADDRRGCGATGAVISHAFWQREYGGAASALGRTLTLDGHPVEIIGVSPEGFFGLEIGQSFDVALPLCAEASMHGFSFLDAGAVWWLTVVGRLRPGWSMDRATAHLTAISPGNFEATLQPSYPSASVKQYLAFKLAAYPAGTGMSMLRSTYSDPLWLLLAMSGLVLTIACANLANLMLARSSAREREIAVRMAIGASRGRLIRQLLAESLLLASLGAVLGGVLAQTLSAFLVSFISIPGNRLFVNLDADWRVLAFTAGLAILTCIFFGLAPALRSTQAAASAVLKAGGRGLTASRERFGLRRMLVVSQIALSLMLLVGALLFSRSLRNLLTVDAGFQQDGVLIANVDFTRLKMPVERWYAFKQDLIERLRTLPGVEAAAELRVLPLSGNSWNNEVWTEGDQRQRLDSYFNWAGPGYFETLRIPLLAGRDFQRRDTVTAPRVAIVNQAFSRRLGLGPDPIGKRFRKEATPGEPELVFEIVGLVKNTKYRRLREDFKPIAFLPASQNPSPEPYAQILIRAREASVISVKQALGEVSPQMGFVFQGFKAQIQEGLLRERLMATLSGFFGILAALLATIGLYGVMSYMVARRRNEIGIRMALGAGRGDILKMILRDSAAMLALGLALGTALALAAARAAGAMFYGLAPHDPTTLVMAAAMLATVAMAASYLPARRAASVDPMAALREE